MHGLWSGWTLALFLLASTGFQPTLCAQRGEQPPSVTIGELGTIPNLDPAVRFELEEALTRKEYGRAEQILAGQVETNPNAPKHQLLVYLGGLFFVDKKYLNSAIAYKKADALEKLDNGNRFTLAMAYVLLGRPDWARPELQKLRDLEPGQPLYAYWVARLDYDETQYAAAIEKLEKIIQQWPDYLRAYDRLGLCYEAMGKNEAAIASYKKAIELNRVQRPSSPWPPMNLGVLLTQLGRLDEAEPYLREAIQVDPNFAPAHYRLGFALEKMNRLEESATSLKEAARLDATYPDPHWALARVLRRTGDRQGAEEAVRQYQKLKKEQKEKGGS